MGDNPDELVDRALFAAPVRDTLFRDTPSDTDTVVHRREAALVSSFETSVKLYYPEEIASARTAGAER